MRSRVCIGRPIFLFQQNTILQKLLLKHNEFADETARGLSEALAGNEYLKMLDLSWNHFMTSSAEYIADIIAVGTSRTS